mgnify:CR=1 FL=1
MEAGNTLNRPSLPTFAVSMPVFDALRRFLCVSGTQVGVPLAPWLYCSDRASSRQLGGFLHRPPLPHRIFQSAMQPRARLFRFG